MPTEYDLSDPTDIDIMRAQYESISQHEWEDYILFTEREEFRRLFNYDERGCLMRMSRQAGQSKRHSDKDIRWGLSIIDKIDRIRQAEVSGSQTEQALKNDNKNTNSKHFTFRVAWHDNGWNGTLCNHPEKNHYCSGFNSLLSERLRKRKEKNYQKELDYHGQPVSEKYLPPCFWGINIFGEDTITAEHDNPAEPRLDHIKEDLPAYSLFSWPFAVSFTRTKEQVRLDGAYPGNLENVRIPKFQSKIAEGASIGFIYCKYSNPLTEEDQQYLVVGCGLITNKGEYNYFGPQEIIEEKRRGRAKYRNFPSMNWALRYSFQDSELLVRLPYKEYFEHVEKNKYDEETRDKILQKITVAISEPELNHCFKYVAMDIDDDEAIFILSKIRKTLIDCKDDGIVPPEEMAANIDSIDRLLKHCWNKRTYFPGFSSICRQLLNWDRPEFPLEELITELKQNEKDEYQEKFMEIIERPERDKRYRRYSSLIKDIKEKYTDNYGLSREQFLHLCMLNLKPFQYKRILSGKLKLSGDWRKTIDDERQSHSLSAICDNPYLLFEDYESYESLLDPVSGEDMDGDIDLFKIDIAYFPDSRFDIERTDLQRSISPNDKRRLRAVTMRYLRTLENTGHCFASAGEVQDAVKSYPLFYNINAEYHIPDSFFERLDSEYIIHFEEDETKIKVISENDTKYYYLYEIFNAEGEIKKVVDKLIREESLNNDFPDLNTYISESCKSLTEKIGQSFDEELFRQERTHLYNEICNQKFFILAGSPGSGKSHELLNLVSFWQENGEKCMLLTPTGKAALRLKTDTHFRNIKAFTIDKVMTDVKNGKITKSDLYAVNNLIIDEMSMVELIKLKNLFQIFNFDLPAFKRLILVGDPNQLPAIGYGKVIIDVLYYLKTHPEYTKNYVELQVNCRQELAESKIIEFSEAFISGGEISHELASKIISRDVEISKGFRIHYWNSENKLFEKLDDEFDFLCSQHNINGNKKERLNKIFKLNPDGSIPKNGLFELDKYQIITPYRSEYFGTGRVNDYIQKLYKNDLDLELINDLFKQSDKIIRTKNYYDSNILLLSNGSIGLVRNDGQTYFYFQELEEPLAANGEDGIRTSEREFFELAYAITVHKAQGSGFDHTFFILPKKPGLLSRELIYTALTRSKNSISIFVQGGENEPFEKSVFEKARNRSYSESRKTTLMLDKPFRYYALEVDGKFIESRVELLIYQALKEVQKEVGEENLTFEYELKPMIKEKQLPMKTDFTLYTKSGIWYWEHLGRLGNKNYEWTWHNVKRKSYEEAGVFENVITTHERNGINPDKIRRIINIIITNEITTEDPTDRYSLHHYSLR
ncbi:MAG: AAA family ATPase [Bacteroidales bacterium]|nr:AAA family ATPase [Bacteroidales bacterium]